MNIKTEYVRPKHPPYRPYYLSVLVMDDGHEIFAEGNDRFESRHAALEMAAQRKVFGKLEEIKNA